MASALPDQNSTSGSNQTNMNDKDIIQTQIKPASGFVRKPTQLALRSFGKRFLGRIVPYYKLCVENLGQEKRCLQCVDIPAARVKTAIQLMQHAYDLDSTSDEESFAQWGAKKGFAYFSELLEELTVVGPDDLPTLLNVKVDDKLAEVSGLRLLHS